jgi:hypothetical protein
MGALPQLIQSYPSCRNTLVTLLEVLSNCELIPQLVKAWGKYIVDSGCKSLDKINQLRD